MAIQTKLLQILKKWELCIGQIHEIGFTSTRHLCFAMYMHFIATKYRSILFYNISPWTHMIYEKIIYHLAPS